MAIVLSQLVRSHQHLFHSDFKQVKWAFPWVLQFHAQRTECPLHLPEPKYKLAGVILLDSFQVSLEVGVRKLNASEVYFKMIFLIQK